MSLEEEFESEISELLLINVLKNREEALSRAEFWAILKETCVALESLANVIDIQNLNLTINSLLIDSSGNIQFNVDQNSLIGKINNNCNDSILINSIGETMMFIMVNYSSIDPLDETFQFVDQLINATSKNEFSLTSIELFADRELNSFSASLLSNDSQSFKKYDDVTSEFQDSYLSTEYSLNTDPDTDSDQSLCITKECDTISFKSNSDSIVDYKSSFLSLNHLWCHTLEKILTTDEEILVLIHAIMKEVSNNLLNEYNTKGCLCIATDNILLNKKGKIFLNFSSDLCELCLKEKPYQNFYDIKYISKVGLIMTELIKSDIRIEISSHVLSMIYRMVLRTDMIINDVIHFCKSNISCPVTDYRTILINLYNRWEFWYQSHLNYLSNLKYKFLKDISEMELKQFLKKVSTKLPMSVYEIFQQNSSWLSGLKYVTKLSKPKNLQNNKRSTYPYEIVQIRQSSAFQPYIPKKDKRSTTLVYPEKSSRIKENSHFRPLVLTSECNSVIKSQDNLLSPIDVLPQYKNLTQCDSCSKMDLPVSSQKNWQSISHLPSVDITTSNNRVAIKHQMSMKRSTKSKSRNSHSFTMCHSNKSLKINTIIDIIQSNILSQSYENNEVFKDRYILSIADFSLSLEKITKNIFCEAMKQRFANIHWSKESLNLLFETVNLDYNDTQSFNQKYSHFINDHYNDQIDRKSSIDKNEDSLFNDAECDNSNSKTSIEDADNEFIALENEAIANYENICRNSTPITKLFRSQTVTKMSNKKSKKNMQMEDKLSTINKNGFTTSKDSDTDENEEIPIPKQLEDTSFYQSIYPSTLMCFPATAAISSPDRNPIVDFSINPNNIQDLIDKHFNINQSIQFKFKELIKTMGLIDKCGDNIEKKLKKQYLHDQSDLQQSLELVFINQMELESHIVEYHSINIDPILEEINSSSFNPSIRFTNEVRNFRNLQMIQPHALVACLFCKGAITSGLMYEFFLIYREFYTPLEFASTLSSVFIHLQRRLANKYCHLINAKFRLLFIIMCWIDGFYKIDFNDLVYSKVMNIVNRNLVPYLKNCNEIFENILNRLQEETIAPLLLQFSSVKEGNLSKTDLIRNIDIEKVTNSIQLSRNDKQKIISWFNINVEKSKNVRNQDVFSILDFSAKDLAICFSLIEQNYFNYIHPCHLLLYINSLSSTDESILQTINFHRFSSKAIDDNSENKYLIKSLRQSGKITHWAISEILRTTDFKLQGKIVKVLIVTCIWCIELNNYATTISILEAIHSNTLKWAPFWNHVKPKTMKLLKELDEITNQFSRNISHFYTSNKRLQNLFLTGSPFLPCLHAMLVNLKLTMVGKSVTKDGCLKWNKLKKVSDILDQVRLYLQFKYVSNNSEINELKKKLLIRIDHLTSISLDILQSHNMLAQNS